MVTIEPLAIQEGPQPAAMQPQIQREGYAKNDQHVVACQEVYFAGCRSAVLEAGLLG